MQWRIWSVAGEALNFGGRRMETIMRIAWLPVVLLLVVQMVSVFLTLSIALERPITFQQSVTYLSAQTAYPRFAAAAWQNHLWPMVGLTMVAFTISLVLIASFMVPLIRYAATGEKPPPGLIRMPFGAAQLRFSLTALVSGLISIVVLFAPLMAAMGALNRHLVGLGVRLSIEDHVKFPSEISLHSVYQTQVADMMAATAKWWVFGVPISVLALCVPLALIFTGLIFRHFHPRRRAAARGEPNAVLRAVTVSAVCIVGVGVVWGVVTGILPRPPVVLDFLPAVEAKFRQFALFAILAAAIIGYFNLRLFAWPGFSVVDRSLSLRAPLMASRGWNLLRILALLGLVFVVTFIMQYVINQVLSQIILPVLLYCYGLLLSTTRLVNSGVSAEWLVPALQWLWALIRVMINIFWMFFSYGVLAGLYGRLYAHMKAARPYMPQ